jgi:type VI secretion system secreted protein Hcp
MKRLAVLFAAALLTLPLFAASDIFLKFEGIPGESTQAAHAGWFEVTSFSWGVSQPGGNGPACSTSHNLNFTRKGPTSERLTQLCKMHAQLPTLTLDIGGERHMLQNVAFAQCTAEPAGGGNAFESYSLNFGRCATHANAMQSTAGVKIAPGALKFKYDAPNAILIGLTPRPEALSIVALNFMGPNAAKITRRQAANNVQGALDELSRTHQKAPTLSLTLNNGQKWTFTDVVVSSYTGTTHPGAESFSLNFTNVQGPMTGFQDLSYKE